MNASFPREEIWKKASDAPLTEKAKRARSKPESLGVPVFVLALSGARRADRLVRALGAAVPAGFPALAADLGVELGAVALGDAAATLTADLGVESDAALLLDLLAALAARLGERHRPLGRRLRLVVCGHDVSTSAGGGPS